MHKKKRILIIDGYNILGAWRNDMGHMKSETIDSARDALTELFRDYAGYSGQQVTVVYDAWLSDRMTRSEEKTGSFSVVFTRKGETADQYIERLVDSYSRDIELDRCEIRVATSDGIEQTVILGRGATRLSARELLAEMDYTRTSGRAHINNKPVSSKSRTRSTVMDHLSDDVRQKLESMRRGGT